jgi:tetratricopeptide (TPR) repeat protein
VKQFLTIIFISFLFFPAKAQFLEDKPSVEKVLRGLDFLYNQQFQLAETEFAPVKEKYADHPVRFLLNALQIQWKNIPIDQNTSALNLYLAELNKCVTASHKYYDKPDYKMECTFFLLAGHGFLALSENYKGSFMSATQEARKALKYFKEGKKYKNVNPEFLFANGLYNYYREMYPETKPIVKPVMMFFDSGNKAGGLAELEKSYRNSVFSRTEAATYLRDIYIKYEANFGKAMYFSSAIHKKYPKNFVFTIAHIESLLLNMKFDEAEDLNDTIKSLSNPVAKLSYHMFEGYIQEHKYKNLSKAEAAYNQALKVKYNDRYTKEYVAIAHLGLARCAKQAGKNAEARNHYKQTLKYAEYLWLINIAKAESKTV